MAQYDGSINLDVRLSRNDFFKGVNDIKRAIESLQSTVESIGRKINSSTVTYIRDINKNVESVSGKVEEASDKAGTFSDNIEHAAENARNVESVMEQTAESAESLRDASNVQGNNETQQRITELEQEAQWLQEVKAHYDELLNYTGRDKASKRASTYLNSDQGQAQYQGISEQIATITSELAKLYDIQQAQPDGGLSAMGESAEQAADSIDNATESVQNLESVLYLTERTQKGVIESASDLENSMDNMSNGRPIINQSEIAEAGDAFDELTRKAQRYQEAIAVEGKGSASFQALEKEIQKTESEIDKLTDQIDQMERSGITGQNREKYQHLNETLSQTRHEFGQLLRIREEAEEIWHPDLSGWNNAIKASTLFNNAFNTIRNTAYTALHAVTHPIELIDRAFGMATMAALNFARNIGKSIASGVVNTLKSLGSAAVRAASNLARLAGSTVISFLRRLAEGARNAAVQLMKMVSSAVISGLKRIGKVAASASKSLLGLNKQAKGDGFKDGLKFIVRYIFGVRSMFMLVRKLRAALGEAFQNMAKKVPEVNKTLSNLASSLDRLKNSLATAFQPILTAIEPILTKLMDSLSEALTKVGMFFATLTGQNYVYKATKAQIDYAKSLDKTKKKAKAAENQLAGFDHLNILKDSSSSSGADDAAAQTSDFQKLPVESWIKDLADRIKALFKKSDFFGIGKLLAKQLNRLINKINFKQLGKKVAKGINAVVDIINGLFDNINFIALGKKLSEAFMALVNGVNWYNLGRAMTQKIRAIIEGLWGFVSGLNWNSIGKAIGDYIQGAFDNIPWETLGMLIGTSITGVFQAIYTAAETFEWGEIGKRLSEGFKNIVDNIDIDTIYAALHSVLIGILDLIGPVLTDTQTWNKIAADFAKFLNKLFQDDTLWDKLKNVLLGGIRTAISSLKTFVSTFEWGTNGKKFHDRVFLLINDFPLNELGTALSELLTGALDFMNEAFGDEGLFETLGGKLADFLDRLFNNDELWSGVGKLANNMMKDVLSFGEGFLQQFIADGGPTKAADNIKAALGEVRWGEIANRVWFLLKNALAAAGSFVDALFSDSTEGLSGEALANAEAFNAKPIGTRIAERLKSVFADKTLFDDVARTVWEGLQSAFTIAGDFIGTLLGVDTANMDAEERIEAIGKALGEKLGTFANDIGAKLAELPWGTILRTAFTTIGGVIQGLINGLLGDESGNGKILLWIAGGLVALKLGVLPLITKLIGGLAIAMLSGGPALAAGLTATIGVAAATGIAKLVETTGEMVQAQHVLNEALSREAESGLTNYAYIYSTCGKDIADKYAESAYAVKLTGEDMEENLEQLGKRIAETQKRPFEQGNVEIAKALGTYKALVSTEGKEAAKAWAEHMLGIELTSDNTADNLNQLSGGIKQKAAEDWRATKQTIDDACDKIDIKVKETTSSVESTTETKSPEIKENLTDPYTTGNAEIDAALKNMEATVDAYTGDIKGDVESNMNETSRIYDENIAGMESSLSSGLGNMKSETESGSNSVQKQTQPFYDQWKATIWIVEQALNTISRKLTTSMGDMGRTVQNSMRDLYTSINNSMQSIGNMNWAYIGQNICNGIGQGIHNGWNWLNNTVWNLANSLFRSAKNALGIHSPSTLFRDEVGYMVGAGLAEGLDDSQHEVLSSVTDMAKAMVDEMQTTDLTADVGVNDDTLLSSISDALSTFNIKIEDSFITLTERLQAIAEKVTFVTPDIAAGTVLPYAMQGNKNASADDIATALEKNNEELIRIMIQLVNNQTSAIVSALERYCTTNVNIDKKSLTDAIVEEVNRRTRAMGISPLLS